MKNKFEGFYTLLSWQDNTGYLECHFMFRQIVPASSNILSLKAADKNQLISYILAIKNEEKFFFFRYCYLAQI